MARRVTLLLDGGDTLVLFADGGPDGPAALRFRTAIWSRGLECHLAALYVVPHRRRLGIGGARMHATLHEARRRGADTMDVDVHEPDTAARRLHEGLGFTNRAGGPGGPVVYVYGREL